MQKCIRLTLQTDRIPCGDLAAAFLLARMVCIISTCTAYPYLAFHHRPAYISYGAFGMVAAHELTVSYLLFGPMTSTQLYFSGSTHLIRLADFTIKMPSSRSGGRTLLAKVSTSDRNALSISTLVSIQAVTVIPFSLFEFSLHS